MIRLKKVAAIFALVLAFTSAMFIGASALTSSKQADSLFEMKLLLGTEKGLELDRAPTRAEAAVMLVRLLGKETEAQAGNYNHTFTDVPAWAQKYIGFLYENGLTKGTSATTFSPQENCSAQMYTTFILRALGYSEDSGDYTYAEALDFGQEIGLMGASIASSDAFIRNDLASISYSALFQNKYSSNSTLLETLISDGAVTSSSADKYMASYDLYKNLVSATADISNTSYEAQQTASVDFTVNDAPFKMTQDSLISAVMSGDTITAKIESSVDFMGNTSSMTSYYSDGWLYTNSESGKYKVEADAETIKELQKNNATLKAFFMVDKIVSTTSDGETVYTVNYTADSLNGIFDSLLSDSGIESRKISSVEQIIAFDSNGKFKSEMLSANMTAEIDNNGETLQVAMEISVSSNIVKTGDSVTVTLPTDLNDYVIAP